MIQHYAQLNRTLRALSKRCTDGLDARDFAENAEILIAEYIRMDLRELRRNWPDGASKNQLLQAENLVEKGKSDRDVFRQIRDELPSADGRHR